MYRKKKRIDKRKIFIISGLILLFIIGYVFNVVMTDRKLNVFERTIKDSVLVIQKTVTYPIDFIIEKIERNKDKNNMYDEYEKLKDEVADFEKYKIENQELRKQISELKENLEIKKTLYEYDSITATVIGRDLSYWNEVITVDKGKSDGVDIGYAVVVKNGLIGKVVNVTEYNSVVKLMKSNNNDKISVKINNDNTYIYGILTEYKDDLFTIEGISQTIDIANGSLVTTTGMGNIYPAGIVIGTLVGVDTDNFGLSKVLKMKSAVDFDNLNYVNILKRKDLE